MEANAAAWGYTKVALLFFVSLLVTWASAPAPHPGHNQISKRSRLTNILQVPSSVNRVYSLIHPELVSLPFTYASGVVLPLMGFWNSVIYITTSWRAVRLLFTGKLQGDHVKRPSLTRSRPGMGSRRRTASESESVRQLAVGEGSGYNQV